MPAHCNRILPMLRIPNRQNPRPQRYHTEFSVQKLSAIYNNGFQVTSENTLREFPLVIATVAKVSRKRGLWLVVRVKKGDTRRYLHFYSFSSAASYVGMIQIRSQVRAIQPTLSPLYASSPFVQIYSSTVCRVLQGFCFIFCKTT